MFVGGNRILIANSTGSVGHANGNRNCYAGMGGNGNKIKLVPVDTWWAKNGPFFKVHDSCTV